MPYKDSDYKHQKGQVNVWIPLTNVGGANSLFLESEVGKQDFKPLTGKPGDLFIFYGNQLEHMTIPNATTDTRISLDFRFVPGCVFDPHAKISRLQEGTQIHRLGTDNHAYYDECVLVRRRKPEDMVGKEKKSDKCTPFFSFVE